MKFILLFKEHMQLRVDQIEDLIERIIYTSCLIFVNDVKLEQKSGENIKRKNYPMQGIDITFE